jgi:cytochrome c oxidase subunit 2
VDVLHAFYLPNFRYKIDAVPGTVNGMWIQATQTGEYAIACAQHCGTNHYKMGATMTVMPKEDFKQWHDKSSAIATAAFDPDDLEAHWGWDWKEM